MKKITAVLLCILILLSASGIISFAESNQTDESFGAEQIYDIPGGYPYIFVHGMGGWGSYQEEFYSHTPYWGGWGGNSDKDVIALYESYGIEAYAASVGPLSSAWDRACELYAQLTGTVVDYGEAHSKAHNHDRYGYSYENNQLMENCWDGESKLNLVGHSFGSETIRLFASLLEYGSQEEIAATGENTSPLFTGGKGESINAVISLSGPNNGSPIANFVYDAKVPMMLISFGLNLIGATVGSEILMWDLNFSQFGLTPKQGEERASFSISNIINFYNAEDNCGYELTLRGARELNEQIKTVPTAYYYSYTARATTTNSLDNEIPISSMFTIFKPSSLILGMLEGRTIDGITLDKDWEINDGIVPLASARYPMTEADNAKSYEAAAAAGEEIERGVWYYMEPMEGFDHFDYSGSVDYPTSFEDFYLTLAQFINGQK